MNEHEPRTPEVRPAPDRGAPDWRRLEVALGRFGQLISDGLDEARAEHREVSLDTARCVAHVLGRAYGRESHLADFGRTGEGSYEELREEYLDLYTSPDADDVTKELIDWFGTYLVEHENIGTGRRFMNEHLPPKLERLLVRTEIEVNGKTFTANVPASLDREQIEGIREELTTLRLDEDEALQAFVSLADVDANTPMLMESFHENFVGTYTSLEDIAVWFCELGERETEVHEFASERGLIIDSISPDYEALLEQLRDGYDLVEGKGGVHVFYK